MTQIIQAGKTEAQTTVTVTAQAPVTVYLYVNQGFGTPAPNNPHLAGVEVQILQITEGDSNHVATLNQQRPSILLVAPGQYQIFRPDMPAAAYNVAVGAVGEA